MRNLCRFCVFTSLMLLCCVLPASEEKHFSQLSMTKKLEQVLKNFGIQHRMTGEQLRNFGRRLEELQAQDCVLFAFAQDVRAAVAAGKDVADSLAEKVFDHEVLLKDVERRLHRFVGLDSQSIRSDIGALAKRIVGNEKSRSETMEKLPQIERIIAAQDRKLNDMNEAIRSTGEHYSALYKSLCERVSAAEDFNASILKRIENLENAGNERVTLRPTLAPPLPAIKVGMGPENPHITPYFEQYCTRDLVQPNYDLHQQDPYGSTYYYYGDMYRGCTGEFVLVTRPKKIGITFRICDKGVHVQTTTSGGAAQNCWDSQNRRFAIKPEDHIISIDGVRPVSEDQVQRAFQHAVEAVAIRVMRGNNVYSLSLQPR